MRINLQLILLSSLMALVGCKSTPKRIAFETIDKTTSLVQEAVRGYGDYMRARMAYAKDSSNPVELRQEAASDYSDMLNKLPSLKKLYEDYVFSADEAVLVLGIPNEAPPTQKMIDLATSILNITNRFLP